MAACHPDATTRDAMLGRARAGLLGGASGGRPGRARLAGAVLLGLALLGARAIQQEEPRLSGLVELPGIFGVRDPDGPPGSYLPGAHVPVPLHAAPERGSPLIAVLTGRDSLEWHELGYEAPAAVAYGETNGWVRVAIGEGENKRYGWVPPDHHGGVHRLGRILLEGLAYTTGDWDGVLREAPSARSPAGWSAGDGDRPIDIDVAEVVEAGGVIWLRVELLALGRCQGTDPEVVARGWLPTLNHEGRPQAWFYSRGC